MTRVPERSIATPKTSESLEAEIRHVGRELAGKLPAGLRHPVRSLSDSAMELAGQHEGLKTALFRFVDVAPACTGRQDMARHLVEYMEELGEPPAAARAIVGIEGKPAGWVPVAAASKAGVHWMAHRFIVGETPAHAVGLLRRLWEGGAASTVDLLGEAAVSHREADRYAGRCEDALKTVAPAARKWRDRPILDRDSSGPVARANLSVKLRAMTPKQRPEAPEATIEDAGRRLRRLLELADDVGAHVHVDMESYDMHEATLDLVFGVLSEERFRRGPSAGLVVQAYLRDSPQTVDRVISWAEEVDREHPLLVRLVKGAYWDHEVALSRQRNWEAPVFLEKADSDVNFERLTRRLLDARPALRVAIASHNLRSLAHAIAYNGLSGAPVGDVELQTLRGLGDDTAVALAQAGYRVRAYCPVGDLVAGMSYLVRRLLENTSNDSFLHVARTHTVDELMQPPRGRELA